MKAKSILETLGNTPLVEISTKLNRTKAHVFAKVEAFNPGGSAKDRVAAAMIDAAEKSGALAPGGTVIEPTSGNTGVGLALVSAVRGYRMILVMPDNKSAERIRLAKAYGAEVVLTPGADGMKGCIAKANELQAAIAEPDVMPHRMPSCAPKARATRPDASADTVSTSVAKLRSKIFGMKFAPMP